jgi:hypothetical protein
MKVLAFLLLGTVGVAGAGVVYLNVASTAITITNVGAAPVQVQGNIPSGMGPIIAAAGLKDIPAQLGVNAPSTIKVPTALSGDVDASTPGRLVVSALGQTFTINATCEVLTLNGASLLGRRASFSLGDRPNHDVQFNCR